MRPRFLPSAAAAALALVPAFAGMTALGTLDAMDARHAASGTTCSRPAIVW